MGKDQMIEQEGMDYGDGGLDDNTVLIGRKGPCKSLCDRDKFDEVDSKIK